MTAITKRPAPRVPAGPNSLVAQASSAPTRRGLLGSVAVAAGAITLAGNSTAKPVGTQCTIEDAFAEWKSVKTQIEAWRENDGEEALWDKMGALERQIHGQAHTSVRAAEVSLWVSLPNLMTMDHEHKAILREDLAYLRQHADDSESGVVIMINMIATLRQLAGQEG